MEIKIETKSNAIHPFITLGATNIDNELDMVVLNKITKVTFKLNDEYINSA